MYENNNKKIWLQIVNDLKNMPTPKPVPEVLVDFEEKSGDIETLCCDGDASIVEILTEQGLQRENNYMSLPKIHPFLNKVNKPSLQDDTEQLRPQISDYGPQVFSMRDPFNIPLATLFAVPSKTGKHGTIYVFGPDEEIINKSGHARIRYHKPLIKKFMSALEQDQQKFVIFPAEEKPFEYYSYTVNRLYNRQELAQINKALANEGSKKENLPDDYQYYVLQKAGQNHLVMVIGPDEEENIPKALFIYGRKTNKLLTPDCTCVSKHFDVIDEFARHKNAKIKHSEQDKDEAHPDFHP